jgi:hypothetical protein
MRRSDASTEETRDITDKGGVVEGAGDVDVVGAGGPGAVKTDETEVVRGLACTTRVQKRTCSSSANRSA